jgi:hypothetical protein
MSAAQVSWKAIASLAIRDPEKLEQIPQCRSLNWIGNAGYFQDRL